MSLHWLDYVVIGIVGLSILTGLFRGFVKELVALCVWILAIWLAFTYTPILDPYFVNYVHDKTARMVVAFIIILLSTILAGGLFNALLSFILSRSGLSGTDRILGMAFGFVRGVFIVTLLIFVGKITAIPDKELSQQSYLYAKFDPLVDKLSNYMPMLMKQVSVLEKNDPIIDAKSIALQA